MLQIVPVVGLRVNGSAATSFGPLSSKDEIQIGSYLLMVGGKAVATHKSDDEITEADEPSQEPVAETFPSTSTSSASSKVLKQPQE